MAHGFTTAWLVASLPLAAGAIRPAPLQAATSDAATARVSVTVPARVRFEAQTRIVQVPVRSLGPIEAELAFRVRANVPAVRVQIEATPLFYGGDPTGPAIPLAEEPGARLLPAAGADARERLVAFAADSSIEGWPARKTEAVLLESGGETFREDLDVTITWELTDPAQPAGQYVGMVRLTTFVGP